MTGQRVGAGDSVETGVTYNPFATVAGGCPMRAIRRAYLPVTMR